MNYLIRNTHELIRHKRYILITHITRSVVQLSREESVYIGVCVFTLTLRRNENCRDSAAERCINATSASAFNEQRER